MGRLPEAWIAPPATRELREMVRHRAKLVALRSGVKCQVHAVLAACGVPVAMSDVFGVSGQGLLDRVALPAARLACRVGRVGRCRSPCFRQVLEQAVQVGAGLGAHGPADALVELGLVETAGAEVLGQAVGDRLALGVGNPHVLV